MSSDNDPTRMTAVERAEEIGSEAAYPFTSDDGSGTCVYFGLTKREYFAGLAMQGMAAGNVVHFENRAVWAVKQADALLAELAK